MKIAIIGGGGQMGQWLCRFLLAEGRDVIIADRDLEKLPQVGQALGVKTAPDNITAVKQADVVIVSVPVHLFASVIQEIGPSVRPNQIVMDVTSVKAGPVAAMREHIKVGTVLGAHPLFGPDVKKLDGQNFVLTPVGEKETALALKVAQFLRARGANVKTMTPHAHDKMMAVVQGLSHFVAIIAADALSGLGDIQEMKDVSTTTFRIFLNYIESVIGEDAALYAAIQMEHPEMPGIYQALTASVAKWADMVKRKDTEAFVESMTALKSFIGK